MANSTKPAAKVRKLCIFLGFTLGVKGLNSNAGLTRLAVTHQLRQSNLWSLGHLGQNSHVVCFLLLLSSEHGSHFGASPGDSSRLC